MGDNTVNPTATSDTSTRPNSPQRYRADLDVLTRVVPAELRVLPQFVCWRYAERKGKVTKVPVNPKTGNEASCADSMHWASFDAALDAFTASPSLAGIGFVFTEEDPFTGVDLDDCLDPKTGLLAPWALTIKRSLNSYNEISPSGTGLKIFVRAKKPGDLCRKRCESGEIEIYDHARYFTLTGMPYNGLVLRIGDRQKELNALYHRYFAVCKGPVVGGSTGVATRAQDTLLTDAAIIEKASANRKSGAKFSALWSGNWEGTFGSQSEADASVIFTLAFYTKDAAQIDRLFRTSGLMRAKWDEPHGQQTYGEMTIARALEKVTAQYQPRKTAPHEKTNRASSAPPPSDLPPIQGNERQLREVRADALAALYAGNRPPVLFRRADGIARIAQEKLLDGAAVAIQQLDVDALRGVLSNSANWFTLKHRSNRAYLVDDLPPVAVARDILAQPDIALPPLNGVITCPTFSADGGLIVEAGYHDTSGLWHCRTIHDLDPVPDAPDAPVVVAARDALLDAFGDFPFVDAASRANALALLLLPFVRPLIAGPTPLHAVDAPSPATGKDLLVKTALLPALGYEIGATTAAKDPDEWRKKITAILLRDSAAILLGNIAHRLDSEHLAAVLTDTQWRDRHLGYTRELVLPNRAIWTATGNNLSFSREITRRVVWIRLDARTETPETRSGFRYSNLIAHVRAHRTRFVHAALTLVRAWIVAGRPAGTQVMGSFEQYAAVVGGILDVAGVPGFLANAVELRRHADHETAEWRAFVQAWWARWRDACVGVRDLSDLLWDEKTKRNDLLTTIITSDNERGSVTQLGRRLSSKRECVIAGYRITVADERDHKDRLVYRLVPTSTVDDGSRHEVGGEVGTANSSDPNVLEQNADFRRLSSQSPRTCIRDAGADVTHADMNDEVAITYAQGSEEKSAKVGKSTHPIVNTDLTIADFDADLPPTSRLDGSKSAIGRPAEPRWFVDAGRLASPQLCELAARREGWTPDAWHARLLQMADACAVGNPQRAAECRQAAALMTREEADHAV